MDANVEYGASSDDGGVGAAACAADGAAQVVLPLSSRGTIDAEAARLMAETPAGGCPAAPVRFARSRSRNIVKNLGYRSDGLKPRATRIAISQWAEGRCVQPGRHGRRFFDMPPGARSTIAMAFAADGRTFASTHGDHTVKVFTFPEGKLIQILGRHPRTPWTVKFHPHTSSILASGCLAHVNRPSEVRVWDVARGEVLHIARLQHHSLSLSFHPSGNLLAIACGRHLCMWNYTDPSAVAERVAHFKRNLRCVLFSPTGKQVITGEEDKKKVHAPESLVVELKCWGFSLGAWQRRGIDTPPLVVEQPHLKPSKIFSDPSLTDDGDPAEAGAAALEVPALQGPAVLARNVVLFNDGGVDISRCGRFLLTCLVEQPKSTSPTTTTEEVLSLATTTDSGMTGDGHVPVVTPGASSVSTAERSGLATSHRRAAHVAAASATPSRSVRPPGPGAPGRRGFPTDDDSSRAGAAASHARAQVPHSTSIAADAASPATPRQRVQSVPAGGVPLFSPPVISHGRARVRSLGTGRTPDQTAPEIAHYARDPRSRLVLPTPSLSPALTPAPVRPSDSTRDSGGARLAGRKRSGPPLRSWEGTSPTPCNEDEDDVGGTNAAKRASFVLSPRQPQGTFASPVPLAMPTDGVLWNVPGPGQVESGGAAARRKAILTAYADHLRVKESSTESVHAEAFAAGESTVGPLAPSNFRIAVVSLSPESLGEQVTTGALLGVGHANVTSIKFSPTGSHLLVGLQPRPAEGQTERPPTSMPVAVMHRTSDMQLLARVMSAIDEVNVALFSPLAGDGFVYGTRQGRVRGLTPLLLDKGGRDEE